MSSKTVSNSKYTEDWIPVKNITNGMIELDNKSKVTGVKIRPRNIFILDKISQDNTIISLPTSLKEICLNRSVVSVPNENN